MGLAFPHCRDYGSCEEVWLRSAIFDRSGADSAIQNEGMFVLLRANRWKRVIFETKIL